MTQIVIPEVGESITSGVISAWLKEDGEYVERDEPVLELETDKITQELVAPASGVLKRTAAAGDEVKIGAVVGEVDETAKQPAGAKASGAAKAESAAGREAASASAAKAAPGVRAHEEGGRGGERGNGVATMAPPPGEVADEDGVRASPTVRRLAAEHGIRLADVSGRGPGGRVREQDVWEAIKGAAAPAEATPAGPRPAAGGQRGIRRERMSPLRQRIATRLVEAQHTAAMLTTFNECDMTAVMDLRSRHKEAFEKKHGVGLGFMSFFVKAATTALQAHEPVNAFIVQGEGGEGDGRGGPAIEYHDYCDVAIAVSTPKGLVVPVLRDCQSLSFAGIERGVKDLAERARDGKLTLDQMQGGTFTITNGGVFGSLLSTPILNPPQSAILGMHTIKKRTVEDPAKPGQIALRPMMYLALSYDHRVIDGAQAVRFLVTVKEAIENPERLLLDL
jgi:2-oxoglutarate dehydrogenase E2 component (dihydrolipoamide succinyltransferase)